MEIKCDICGKTGFKSKAGLAGHMKIAHSADTRKTVKDEIGKRLDTIEKSLKLLAKAWATTTKQLTENDNRLLDTVGKLVEELNRALRSTKI